MVIARFQSLTKVLENYSLLFVRIACCINEFVFYLVLGFAFII